METQLQWARIKELVGAALELKPEARQAYLDELLSGDDPLRLEVESLLAAYESSDDLEDPASLLEAELDDLCNKGTASAATVIGPYRLIRELGTGGMGQVWLAEQTRPVRRQVALKLIREGFYSSSVLQRFLAERQSLASMDHPSIARVFDAGATEAGQPYLVMEFVDGEPITGYCDRKQLDIPSRLKLFLRVCEGVQHAHQKAIIHRDLKPSNILVVDVDGQASPRLIDFGLAKSVGDAVLAGAGSEHVTQAGFFLGTPAYMSPEQALGGNQDVDTRSDVYSLGVVLYELLTGSLPFDGQRGSGGQIGEFLEQLREADTPRPSQRVLREASKAGGSVSLSSASRSLSATLRGDLDWIALKALEKERERRYESPSALAADIENYLDNRPVAARQISTGYRLRKYLRRNRVGVTIACGAFLLLVVFAVIQAMQLRRITEERDRARRERDRADRLAAFMTNMFNLSDPSEARGNSITAREVLDRASRDIPAQLKQDPQSQTEMMETIGTVYSKLGLYAKAEELLKQASEVGARSLGREDRRTLEAERRLGWALYEVGKVKEAEENDRAVIATEGRTLGANDRDTLAAESDLMWILDAEGRYDEAVKLGRSTLQAEQHAFGKRDRDTLLMQNRLSEILGDGARISEAVPLAREAFELDQTVFGPEHQVTLNQANNLGGLLQQEGKLHEAEQLLAATVATQRRVMGAQHQNTLATMDSLASVLQNEHQFAQSEALYRQAYESFRETLGPSHPQALEELGHLASLLNEEGKWKEAEKLDRQVLDLRTRSLGPSHPDIVVTSLNLADVIARQGKYDDAIAIYREVLRQQREREASSSSLVLETKYRLAATLTRAGREEEALEQLSSAVDNGLPVKSSTHDMAADADFHTLRRNPRFAALMKKAQRQ